MNAAQARRVDEARDVLRALGFGSAQTNQRSALVLLCLLDLDKHGKLPDLVGTWRTATG